MLRDHRLVFSGRSPAIGTPAGRRNAVAERANHHEHEVDRAHGEECFPHALRVSGLVIVHQHVGERSADHGAAAEAHDGHAGCHAAAIREPFHQRRHRRDVAKAEADAADDAGAEPHQPELVGVDADGAKHEAAAPAQCSNYTGLARARAFKPAAPDRGSDAEHHEEERIHPAEAGDPPIAIRRDQFLKQIGAQRRVRNGARQRQPEYAEAVGHADAEMDAECGWRHQPAVEACRGDDALAVENARPAKRRRLPH